MTNQVKKALDYVREFFPDVCIVAFNREGQWQYFTEDWFAPHFTDGMVEDIGILQDAVDSLSDLPAIFQLDSDEYKRELLT